MSNTQVVSAFILEIFECSFLKNFHVMEEEEVWMIRGMYQNAAMLVLEEHFEKNPEAEMRILPLATKGRGIREDVLEIMKDGDKVFEIASVTSVVVGQGQMKTVFAYADICKAAQILEQNEEAIYQMMRPSIGRINILSALDADTGGLILN